jgi:carbon-monoxide dehydrogenase large subunit
VDVGSTFTDIKLVECPSTKNPLGAKAIGESGTVPAAAAIISGVEDPLRDFGIRIEEAPISPARLSELMRSASRAVKYPGFVVVIRH